MSPNLGSNHYCCNYTTTYGKKSRGSLNLDAATASGLATVGKATALLKGFLQRTLQSRAAVWVIVCVQHFNGTIVLLNTTRMEKYAQLLAFGP
jgi:hypothetical protein